MSTRFLHAVGVWLGAASLAGCTVTFEARKVEPGTVAPPGIVYQLPMTRIDTVVKGTLSSVAGGELGKLDQWASTCLIKPAETFLIGARERTTLSLQLPQLIFSQVPDPEQTYSVQVKTDLFATMAHTLENFGDGFVSGLTSSGENRLGETVVSLAKNFIGLATGAPPAATASNETPSKTDGAEKGGHTAKAADCYFCNTAKFQDREKLYAKLNDQLKPGLKLGCKDVGALSRLIGDEQEKVRTAREKLRNELAVLSSKGGGQEQLVASLVDLHEKNIKSMLEDVVVLQTGLHVLPSEKERHLFKLTQPKGFVPLAPEAMGKHATADGPTRRTTTQRPLAGSPASCPVPRAGAQDSADGWDRWELALSSFAVQLLNPAETTDVDDVTKKIGAELTCSTLVIQAKPASSGNPRERLVAEPASGGYRYRLPARGFMETWLVHSAVPAVKVYQEVPVSQYGQLVALPSEFSGKGAKLNLSYSDKGTLKKVELGQTAQDPEAVAGSAKGLVDAIRSKPAPADPVAALEQSVKQQRLELCKQALAATSSSSTSLPAVCEGL